MSADTGMAAGTQGACGVRQRHVSGLLLVGALGLALRVYHVLATVAVSPDGALFIDYARALAHEPREALRSFQQHPLYPALLLSCQAPVGWIIGDRPEAWILAGQLGAIAGSLGAIAALYWLATRLYDRTRGLIAAAMLAVLPDACRFGADVLTDLPHLALYLTGLAAVVQGMQRRRAAWLLLAAAAGALAFLTRPEGGAVLPIGVAILLVHRVWPLRRRLGLAAAMAGVFFCVTGPYQLMTGRLIQKKSLSELFQLEEAARTDPGAGLRAGSRSENGLRCGSMTSRAASSRFDIGDGKPTLPLRPAASGMPADGRVRRAGVTELPVPVNVLYQWVRAGRVVYILLALLGLVVARPTGVGARTLALALGVHLLLLHALEQRYGYLDRRHALILATLSLPVAAAGVWWLSGVVAQRLRAPAPAARRNVVIGVLGVTALATTPWLFRPINAGDEHLRACARWLREHTEPGTLIVTDSRLRRLAVYADRPFAEWPWWQGGVRHLAAFLEGRPDCCFVVDVRHITSAGRNPAFFEQLAAQFGPRLELRHSAPAPPNARHPTEIRVYRYHGP